MIYKKGLDNLIMIVVPSILIIISLLILAAYAFFIDSPDVSLKSNVGNDVGFTLLNYLNTPTRDGKIITLINLFYYDRVYETELVSETKRIFDGMYGDLYYFYILDEEDELIFIGNYHSKRTFEKRIKIPIFDKDLEVVLNPTQFYDLKETQPFDKFGGWESDGVSGDTNDE